MSFWQDQARRRALQKGRRRWLLVLLLGLLLVAGGLAGPQLTPPDALPSVIWLGGWVAGAGLVLLGLAGLLYAALQPAPPPPDRALADQRFGNIPSRGFDDSITPRARRGPYTSEHTPRPFGQGRRPSPPRKTPRAGPGKPDRRPPWQRGS